VEKLFFNKGLISGLILLGKVWVEEDTPAVDVHILLKAPDDDTAIREALNALSEDGYAEASFDQIGTLVDQPDEEPHASAYQGALEAMYETPEWEEVRARNGWVNIHNSGDEFRAFLEEQETQIGDLMRTLDFL
jgi:hypothetical protein